MLLGGIGRGVVGRRGRDDCSFFFSLFRLESCAIAQNNKLPFFLPTLHNKEHFLFSSLSPLSPYLPTFEIPNQKLPLLIDVF